MNLEQEFPQYKFFVYNGSVLHQFNSGLYIRFEDEAGWTHVIKGSPDTNWPEEIRSAVTKQQLKDKEK